MAIKIVSAGQAALKALHQMGCDSVTDGRLAQGYVDCLASPLEQNNRFEEAQIVRELAAQPYSEQQHTALLMIDSVARLELSQDKTVSQFNSTLRSLKGESTDTDKVLKALASAFYKLAHESQEANTMLRYQIGI